MQTYAPSKHSRCILRWLSVMLMAGRAVVWYVVWRYDNGHTFYRFDVNAQSVRHPAHPFGSGLSSEVQTSQARIALLQGTVPLDVVNVQLRL